jgi:hypothetical protein
VWQCSRTQPNSGLIYIFKYKFSFFDGVDVYIGRSTRLQSPSTSEEKFDRNRNLPEGN